MNIHLHAVVLYNLEIGIHYRQLIEQGLWCSRLCAGLKKSLASIFSKYGYSVCQHIDEGICTVALLNIGTSLSAGVNAVLTCLLCVGLYIV